jgi:dinuclear metal center YbgI/SA1388 family protein
MTSIPLPNLVRECNRLLRPERFVDWDGAANGLQVANQGRVSSIAAAVDATAATIRLALNAGANLLLVHHGLFWETRQPWTGPTYALLRLLLENNLAVYSSHLPLDAHPRLGNNAGLASALGFRKTHPFLSCRGQKIGLAASSRIPLDDLTQRLGQAVAGPVRLLPGGPQTCRRIGIVSGAAGADLRSAAAEGVDTFITGEGPHWTFGAAEEIGLNVLYAGHYATETFGVKALAQHLGQRFRLPWSFVDHPSGL